MAIQVFDVEPPEKPKNKNVQVFDVDSAEALEPTTLEVLKGVPERTGLSVLKAAGGAARLLGDVIGAESLASWGGDLARNAEGAQEMSMPVGATQGQRYASAGLESALSMAPTLALLPVAGAATVTNVGMTTMMAQAGASSYTEKRDYGLGVGRSFLHASIDALAEGVGERYALPALHAASRGALNKVWEFMRRDMAGEQLTTAINSLNAKLSDNPNMTLGEYLEAAKATAIVTPIAAGAQVGAARLITGVAGGQTAQSGDGSAGSPSATPPLTAAPEVSGPATPEATSPPQEAETPPVAAPVIPSEPTASAADVTKLEGLVISVPIFVETLGEMQEVTRPADVAFNEAQVDVARYKQVKVCLGS